MIIWPWQIWRRQTIWKNHLEPDLEIAAFCPPKPKITQLDTFHLKKHTSHLSHRTPPNYQPRPGKKLQLHPLPKKHAKIYKHHVVTHPRNLVAFHTSSKGTLEMVGTKKRLFNRSAARISGGDRWLEDARIFVGRLQWKMLDWHEFEEW